ncbi:uncharacterized protein LOC116375769 [Oncorhynchus kisutch]|uniref:uncharacterized protein LOC116375769 n=1 Tax=Oncorhynchus kisutch TaxID=8019 RepID=UPI0012DC2A1D|nr:uncharacterized protein LOC116375769 [Oncorhynchus kisutch]
MSMVLLFDCDTTDMHFLVCVCETENEVFEEIRRLCLERGRLLQKNKGLEQQQNSAPTALEELTQLRECLEQAEAERDRLQTELEELKAGQVIGASDSDDDILDFLCVEKLLSRRSRESPSALDEEEANSPNSTSTGPADPDTVAELCRQVDELTSQNQELVLKVQPCMTDSGGSLKLYRSATPRPRLHLRPPAWRERGDPGLQCEQLARERSEASLRLNEAQLELERLRPTSPTHCQGDEEERSEGSEPSITSECSLRRVREELEVARQEAAQAPDCLCAEREGWSQDTLHLRHAVPLSQHTEVLTALSEQLAQTAQELQAEMPRPDRDGQAGCPTTGPYTLGGA